MSKNNGSIRKRQSNGKLPDGAVIAGKNDIALTSEQNTEDSGSWLRLLICVGGIYASLYAHAHSQSYMSDIVADISPV